jgi:LmbE family N-acetylglucosaminyl deacetylase
MTNGLTLMAVHAHPDDEVLGTGGVLARYSAEGIRTVLVTCTNGEQGDAPGGAKPGRPGHDAVAVARLRLEELGASVAVLGVSHLELLGYQDSGMVGWEANQSPGAFCNVPLAEVTDRVAGLMRRYRPQVVITYDENGGYGHPDHIQAHRATVAAAEAVGGDPAATPAKLYYSAVPRSAFAELRQRLADAGTDTHDLGIPPDFGVPDEVVTTVVDVSAYGARKRQALAAHASQAQNFLFTHLPEDALWATLSREWFTLRSAPDGLAGEDDLMAGLR